MMYEYVFNNVPWRIIYIISDNLFQDGPMKTSPFSALFRLISAVRSLFFRPQYLQLSQKSSSIYS